MRRLVHHRLFFEPLFDLAQRPLIGLPLAHYAHFPRYAVPNDGLDSTPAHPMRMQKLDKFFVGQALHVQIVVRAYEEIVRRLVGYRCKVPLNHEHRSGGAESQVAGG